MNLLVNGLLIAVCMMILQSYSEAAASFGRFEDPRHPGKCVIKWKHKRKFPFYGCSRVICLDNSIAHVHTCGTLSPKLGCKLGNPVYPKDAYPKCCIRQSICDSNESTIS